MTLQSAGDISISEVKTELSSSSGSLATLSTEAGKSTPHALTEFYGYSAGPNAPSNFVLDEGPHIDGDVDFSFTDNSSDELGFDIEYNIDYGGWTTWTTTSANNNSGIFPAYLYGASSFQSIILRVRSANASGESAWVESNEVYYDPV